MSVQLVQLSGCVHSLSQNTWLQVKRLHKRVGDFKFSMALKSDRLISGAGG